MCTGRLLGFTRSLRELVGLGHRLYLVDSLHGALFSRPLALFLFSGMSTKPIAAIRHE